MTTFFPKKGGDFNYERLMGLLSDIDGMADGISIRKEIVDAGNYDYKFKSIYEDLDKGNAVFVLTTYQTIGSGKNIQYKIPEIEKDNMVYCNKDERGEKDFDAIFLLTPTNLLQLLSFYSENRHSDLAKYLFQQEYLYQNGYLTYSEMKHNIANGFRKVFFSNEYSSYLKNKTAQILLLCCFKDQSKVIFTVFISQGRKVSFSVVTEETTGTRPSNCDERNSPP